MLLTKELEITWATRTKKHYIDLGYDFTSVGDKFLIKTVDLTKSSSYRVHVKCIDCGRVKYIKYCDYVKNINKNNKYICRDCGQKYISRTKCHEVFIKQFYKKYGLDFKVLGFYNGCREPIKISHNCGEEFYRIPNHLLDNKTKNIQCPKCYEDYLKEAEVKREHGKKIKQIQKNAQNEDRIKNFIKICKKSDFEVIEIKNTTAKIKHICKICNHNEFETNIKKFTKDPRCNLCKTKEYKLYKLLKDLDNKYELLSQWNGLQEKILMKCNICNNVWSTTPECLMNKGSRCPECYIIDRCKYLGIDRKEWGKSESRQNDNQLNKWSKSVIAKYRSKCFCCGSQSYLNAHHLDGYNWCIEKRYDILNGVALCEKCHKQFHIMYGYGNNTKKQFEDYIAQQEQKDLAV